jgi:hypothetical protein
MNLLQQHGAQPQKQPRYTPIFMDRAFTGLYTQRNVLHDPSDVATARFYGGRPDALWMGKNIELTNRLTLQRRPGLVPFSADIYPTVPLRAFSFQLTDGTIRVIIDTGSTGSLAISSVASSVGSTAVYTGVFPNGGSNAFAGFIFQIAGFSTTGNNGTFTVTASTTTTLTVSNANAVAETHAATGISAGAVYWDQQNGVTTFLFGKAPGAGQTYFLAVAGILYMGDGVETRIYTPLNPNGTIFNMGGVGASGAPGTVVTSSGTAAGVWQASTFFLTMGLVIDANGNIEQLSSISGGTTVGSVAVVGKSSSGGPNWNQTPGGTTPDNTVTWRNVGRIVQWTPNTPFESETQAFSTNIVPCACYSTISGCVYVAIQSAALGSSGVLDPGAFTSIPGAVIRGNPFFQQTVDWLCLGSAASMPNGFCTGNWPASTAVLGPPNQTRVIEPFTIPPAGQPLNATIYLQESTNTGTTASSFGSISWTTVLGNTTTEPVGSDGSDLTWRLVQIGNAWVAGTAYTAWSSPNQPSFGVVKDANGSFWVAVQSGTSGLSDPFAVAGWYWQSNHPYTSGTIIIDTNSNRQQAQNTGTSTNGVHPVWNRNQGGSTTDTGVTWKNLGSAYGATTPDNGITWVNVGRFASWTASSKYYLPNSGFSPPFSQTAFGSPDVNDGTNIEFVVQSGFSGTVTPTWNPSSTPGSNETYDPSPAAAGGVVWYNNGVFKQNSLSFSTSLSYAYSYKARTLIDFYSILIPGTNTPVNTPPPGPPFNGPLPAPTGSETGFITTATPATTVTGANAGAVISVYGQYSADPQFDTIVIWRSADGGGPGQMFELTEIPNIPSQAGSGKYTVNGIKYDWVFQDFLPSVATGQFPGLNVQISAPINGVNNPVPSNFLPMVFNFQRIWGVIGQNVLFSGGPDAPTGNPNFSFPATNSLPFLASVTRLVRTPQGIITFTVDSIELIAGGPATATFYSVTLSPGVGLLSFNFLDVYAGEIFFFSADNEFMVLSPSLNLANFGFPLGDQFANLPSSGVSDTTWNPATGYVAVHQSGIDNCIFVADGATGWYRLNPRQVPGGLAGAEPIWSPFAAITGGCHMVQSIEYTPGIKALLVGASTGGHNILKRSLSVFTDNGTPYDANFTMGGIMLAHPGQRALLKFIEIDFSGVDFSPTISYLLNEISGSFTPFTADAEVFDPPSIYGTTITPASYSPNRYYFASNASLAVCRHLQIKVDLGTTSTGDELYNLTIFGKLIVEL